MIRHNNLEGRIEKLAADLSDVHPLERQCAAYELAEIGRPAIPTLLRLLASQQDHLRWEACRALSKMGDPATAEALVRELSDEDAGTRCIAGLGLISLERQGIEPLLAVLSRGCGETVLHESFPVLFVLARRPWGKPLQAVLRAMQGPDPAHDVARAAETALASLRANPRQT